MLKYTFYKQIYDDYRTLYAEGRQDCSFASFCQQRGTDYHRVSNLLRENDQNISVVPGYKRIRKKAPKDISQRCSMVYNDFKKLCAEGRQPGPFIDYYTPSRISREQMRNFQKKIS